MAALVFIKNRELARTLVTTCADVLLSVFAFGFTYSVVDWILANGVGSTL